MTFYCHYFYQMFLQCHSYFSLRYGILSPKDLLLQIATQSVESAANPIPVCLTDINNVSGIPDFFREAKQHPQIQPCAGIDFREGETGGRCLYVGIAENETGFAEMNRFLSQYRLAQQKLPSWPPTLDWSAHRKKDFLKNSAKTSGLACDLTRWGNCGFHPGESTLKNYWPCNPVPFAMRKTLKATDCCDVWPTTAC
jgi:DNA polymerase III alpha subunit